MKKAIIAVAMAVMAVGAFARPHGGFHGRGHFRPAPIHHHYHHSGWGRGGRYFWPGFVGGVVGGIVYDSLVTPNVVVTQPVVTQPVVTQPVIVKETVIQQPQQVWVEGRYVERVDANGKTVRVWEPGHYEQR